MSLNGPLCPDPGVRVAKNSPAAPPDRWFADLYGNQWRDLPVGTMFQVDSVSAMVPEFGGPVVHLVTIPGNAQIAVPKAWFTPAHFRQIPKMSGQQPYPFLEPDIRRRR